ncbi:MAG: AraC family transcriptional regulator [Bacteroidota bacterium]|nr:AraC family transcriptional regulator [Bacteroidota bacterium]
MPLFPNLAPPFEKANSDSGTSILFLSRPAGDKALGLVNDLLRSPFVPGLNEYFFEYKVREYYYLLLVETSKTEEPRINLTPEQEQRILDLKVRLDQDPTAKYPIARLAQEMEMNEEKFKLAFKQVTGKPSFEYHMDQRMKEAHRLLKESDLPIKAIAAIVGYRRTTSFITRFRKHFGYPPSHIQKKAAISHP